jgi:succinate dehydrogenase / fumarate reductase iron-sulfur subunit
MKLTLHVWRQETKNDPGEFKTYELDHVSPDMSFLEMLDLLNEEIVSRGEVAVAFEHDCREGICGACSLVINGVPHGPEKATTTCQLHMRSFKDGEHVYIEPWRAKAFPVIKDLVVNRKGLDKIIEAGGFISVNTGPVPDANNLLISKEDADKAMDAAACIGCGACVAACKNGSALLFLSAKAVHLAHLPQGQIEKKKRAKAMVEAMDEAGFGHCTNTLECEAVCPKEISADSIAQLNLEFLKASLG